MPYNLLLLPLLGGYIFARYWYRTRYYVIRAEKERLLIIASVCGVAVLFLTYLFHLFGAYLFPCSNYSFCFPILWQKQVQFEYSGVSLAAFLLGAFGWMPANYAYKKYVKFSANRNLSKENKITNKDAYQMIRRRETDRIIDEEASLFEDTLRRVQDENLSVLITTVSNKIYIGWVTYQFNPGVVTNFISLLPLESGFRDKDTKQVFITTN